MLYSSESILLWLWNMADFLNTHTHQTVHTFHLKRRQFCHQCFLFVFPVHFCQFCMFASIVSFIFFNRAIKMRHIDLNFTSNLRQPLYVIVLCCNRFIYCVGFRFVLVVPRASIIHLRLHLCSWSRGVYAPLYSIHT